jgi:hypothetical protein|tara:strand:- start:258 stop:443 length:186 start_codon:yes stop_codon:yes gene_type:complete
MKTIIKNNYEFKIVNYYLDKMVVRITPMFGVTPTNLEEYPIYETRNVDETLEDIVYDLTTI